ncbi:TRAP transporter small permease subunit [Corynebacterium sp.]|uniref:TRAP transporter small permease subunit n=1 Tax=Corynebacterium sp. TaxID=1720 RepID=UPI0026DED27F|nr:TRAP transporter small permease [Corynebacterium sp.]MDO5511737.1 TRAP transporter small permease [Corynebacterium sp.]
MSTTIAPHPAADHGALAPVRRVVSAITTVMATLSGIAAVAMGLHVVADVVARNLFNSPIAGTLEFITYWWMPIIIFLAVPYVEQKRAQITVTLMSDALTGRHKDQANVLITVVTALIFALVLFLAFSSFTDAMEISQTSSGSVQVPIWLGKAVMFVGLAQGLLQMLVGSPKPAAMIAP